MDVDRIFESRVLAFQAAPPGWSVDLWYDSRDGRPRLQESADVVGWALVDRTFRSGRRDREIEPVIVEDESGRLIPLSELRRLLGGWDVENRILSPAAKLALVAAS